MIAFFLLMLGERYRGGGIFGFGGTQVRRIAYSLIVAGLIVRSGAELNPAVTAVTDKYLLPYLGSPSVVAMSLLTLAVFVPFLTGFGRPIAATGNWEKKELEEFKPLDFLASVVANWFPKTMRLEAWGVAWMTLWGAAAGSLLGFLLGAWEIVIGYSLIGAILWLVFRDFRKYADSKRASAGWPCAEWVVGAVRAFTLISAGLV